MTRILLKQPDPSHDEDGRQRTLRSSTQAEGQTNQRGRSRNPRPEALCRGENATPSIAKRTRSSSVHQSTLHTAASRITGTDVFPIASTVNPVGGRNICGCSNGSESSDNSQSSDMAHSLIDLMLRASRNVECHNCHQMSLRIRALEIESAQLRGALDMYSRMRDLEVATARATDRINELADFRSNGVPLSVAFGRHRSQRSYRPDETLDENGFYQGLNEEGNSRTT